MTLTARILGDPSPDYLRRKAEADERRRIGKTLASGAPGARAAARVDRKQP